MSELTIKISSTDEKESLMNQISDCVDFLKYSDLKSVFIVGSNQNLTEVNSDVVLFAGESSHVEHLRCLKLLRYSSASNNHIDHIQGCSYFYELKTAN